MTSTVTGRRARARAYTPAHRRVLDAADCRVAELVCDLGEAVMRRRNRRRPQRAARLGARACVAIVAMIGAAVGIETW